MGKFAICQNSVKDRGGVGVNDMPALLLWKLLRGVPTTMHKVSIGVLALARLGLGLDRFKQGISTKAEGSACGPILV